MVEIFEEKVQEQEGGIRSEDPSCEIQKGERRGLTRDLEAATEV